MVPALTNIVRFQGSLAVVLDSGMELTIPNELLVVPQKLIDDSGEVNINTTYSEVLLRPTLGNDAADIPMVGKMFFSSNYLFVDHDAGTFTVWQANNTQDTRLVSVGDNNCSATEPKESSGSGSASQPLPKTNDSSQNAQGAPETEKESVSLSTSTIVGIAVGASAVLVTVAIIACLCFTRRNKRKSLSEKGLLADSSARHGHEHGGVEIRHELHNGETSELAAVENPRELEGTKLAQELDGGYKSRTSRQTVYEMG